MTDDDVARRAYLALSRGTVVSADDKPKMQELTIRDRFGDQKRQVEHWQPAGMSMVPLPPQNGKEAEVIVGYLGGSPDHPVVLGTADRRTRPTDAQPGDLIFYDPRNNQRRMTFSESGGNGTLKISMPTGSKIVNEIGGVKFELSQNGMDVTGGYIKHNGKRIDADHKHAGVEPGAGQTDVPIAVLAMLVAADLIVRLIGPEAIIRTADAVLRAFA